MIENLFYLFPCIVIAVLVTIILFIHEKITDLVEDKERIKKRYKKDKEVCESCKKNDNLQVEMLLVEVSRLNEIIKCMEDNSMPDGTIEAVRFAMIKSHPDNGGNKEQFIKFKKCYDNLICKFR